MPCLAGQAFTDGWTLKMEAAHSSETSVAIHKEKWHKILDDLALIDTTA